MLIQAGQMSPERITYTAGAKVARINVNRTQNYIKHPKSKSISVAKLVGNLIS